MKAKFGGLSKQVTDLKVELKRMMFVDKRPMIVSQNSSKFAMIMSAFHNYEKTVSSVGGRVEIEVLVKCYL